MNRPTARTLRRLCLGALTVLALLYGAERALHGTTHADAWFFTILGVQVAGFVGTWILYGVRWHRARGARDGSDAHLPLAETFLVSIAILLLPVAARRAATGDVAGAVGMLSIPAILLLPMLLAPPREQAPARD